MKRLGVCDGKDPRVWAGGGGKREGDVLRVE